MFVLGGEGTPRTTETWHQIPSIGGGLPLIGLTHCKPHLQQRGSRSKILTHFCDESGRVGTQTAGSSLEVVAWKMRVRLLDLRAKGLFVHAVASYESRESVERFIFCF